jgi:hypothetical protein
MTTQNPTHPSNLDSTVVRAACQYLERADRPPPDSASRPCSGTSSKARSRAVAHSVWSIPPSASSAI